jgi:hypothetical protein
MYKEQIQLFIFMILFAIAFAIVSGGIADQRMEQYIAISDCVEYEARNHGFNGSYQDEWDLFAEGCN